MKGPCAMVWVNFPDKLEDREYGMLIQAVRGAKDETWIMRKTNISPEMAMGIAALFAGIGIWRATAAEPWQGGAMFALAAIWVVVAMRQAKKGER